jgi:hypothetical protein
MSPQKTPSKSPSGGEGMGDFLCGGGNSDLLHCCTDGSAVHSVTDNRQTSPLHHDFDELRLSGM